MPAGIIKDYRDLTHSTYGIFIGINKYKNTSIHSLNGCVNDAIGIRDALSLDDCILLLDVEAERNVIFSSISNYMNPQEKNLRGCLLIFSIASHGLILPETEEMCITPYDFDVKNGLGTVLSTITLVNAFSNIARRGGKVLLILDVCRAGGINFDISKYSGLLSHGGISCISSASVSEVSVEKSIEGKPRGLFTYFLEKGLRGEADIEKTGCVTLRDWFDYTYDNVVANNPQQHPLLIGTLPGNTIIRRL